MEVVIEEEHVILEEEEHEALVDEEHEAWQNNADTPNEDNILDPTFESPKQRRCRRPPLWMKDYETREGFSEDSTKANLALSTMLVGRERDPIHFDVDVKIEKWRKAMDEEMEEINRNGTLVLMELPWSQESWSEVDL